MAVERLPMFVSVNSFEWRGILYDNSAIKDKKKIA
jgi:hypothetical protein